MLPATGFLALYAYTGGEFLRADVWKIIQEHAANLPQPLRFHCEWHYERLPAKGSIFTLRDFPQGARRWVVADFDYEYSIHSGHTATALLELRLGPVIHYANLDLSLLLALSAVGFSFTDTKSPVSSVLKKAGLPATWEEWQEKPK